MNYATQLQDVAVNEGGAPNVRITIKQYDWWMTWLSSDWVRTQ